MPETDKQAETQKATTLAKTVSFCYFSAPAFLKMIENIQQIKGTKQHFKTKHLVCISQSQEENL